MHIEGGDRKDAKQLNSCGGQNQYMSQHLKKLHTFSEECSFGTRTNSLGQKKTLTVLFVVQHPVCL